MPPERRDRFDRETDRFWDDVTLGDAADPAGVDPADVATIRFLHTHDDRPDPGPAFSARLRAELTGRTTLIVVCDPQPAIAPNGRIDVPPRSAPFPTPRPERGDLAGVPRWRFISIAAAILLFIAGGGAGYRAFGPGNAGAPATIVAPTVAPTAAVTPVAEMTATSLVTVIVDGETLRGVVASTLTHATIAPGARTTWDAPGAARLIAVLSGSLTVRADGRLRLQRSGLVGVWEDFGAGAEIDLLSGDIALLLHPASVTIDNPGQAAAEIVSWSLVKGADAAESAPPGWTIGDQQTTGADGITAPSPDTKLRLRRIDLPPAARAPALPDAFLTLAVAPAAGSLDRGADGSAANAGTATITVYVLSLLPWGQ